MKLVFETAAFAAFAVTLFNPVFAEEENKAGGLSAKLKNHIAAEREYGELEKSLRSQNHNALCLCGTDILGGCKKCCPCGKTLWGSCKLCCPCGKDPNFRICKSCKKDRGRALEEGEISSPECVSEKFDLFLRVEGGGSDTHILAVAEEKCDESGPCLGCPSRMFHATWGGEHGEGLVKAIHETPRGTARRHGREVLLVGSYKFATILNAFDDAKIETDAPYDLVTNNCASFLINMVNNLGIDPSDPEIIAFASRELTNKSSSFLIDGMMKSEIGIDMIDANENEDGAIKDFVLNYVLNNL